MPAHVPDDAAMAEGPKAVWLLALLASLGLGAGYAASTMWLDSIVVAALFIIIAAFVLPTLYGATSRFAIIRVILGLIGAALGLAALWGLRYGLEFSWSELWTLVGRDPMAAIDRFTGSSDRFQFPITTDAGSQSQGPSPTTMVWMAHSVMLGVMPIFGAISGPKAMDAIRRMRAGSAVR